MSYEELIEEVRARSGFQSGEEAERMLVVVLEVLGEGLRDGQTLALAETLPRRARLALQRHAFEHELRPEEIYTRVEQRTGLKRSFAVEHTQVVCQVLAAAVGEEVRAQLAGRLPRDIAELLTVRPSTASPPPPASPALQPGWGRTLADGRPGSFHPLSDAEGEAAHGHSVVCSDNPHGDTKLSSTQGHSPERTLASGKPGSKHPVSEGD
jgi:uncharacterized protein (DUF2267 family)